MKKRKSVLRIIITAFVAFVVSIVSLVAVVFVGLNVAKFAIYSDFYNLKSDVCENPGLNDGFVPQGIAVLDDHDLILTSGYMNKKGQNSRIYVSDKKSARYIKLTKNNEVFTGHLGGVAASRTHVYLADGKTIYQLPVSDFTNSEIKELEIGQGTRVNNSASYVFCDDTYLYVGEFHDGGKYVTNHHYETDEGDHYAIVSKYDLNDLTTPILVYSVRDKVQGFAIKGENIYLSTSYGLTDSYFYIYDQSGVVQSNETLDGAEVKYLVNHVKSVKAPAMSEGIDVYGDKIITIFESACDKYIFGKFFFAFKTVALKI